MTLTRLSTNKYGEPIFCKKCGTRLVKTPDVSADWYLCSGVMMLQSHCLNCGLMFPPVEEKDYQLSNNKKYDINNVACKEFKIRYKIGSDIVKTHKAIQDPYEYIDIYSMDLAEITGKSYTSIHEFCKQFIEN